jgi:NarL family two-component system response regulator LiaR
MIKLFLVDDQPAALRSLRQRLELETDISVVGEANNGEQALELVPRLRPDIVLMDIVMPGLDGIATTTELQTVAPSSLVVMLSLYDDPGTRERAQAAGAVAFVPKNHVEETLLATVRRAAQESSPQH